MEACLLLPGGEEGVATGTTIGIDENASGFDAIISRLATVLEEASNGRRSLLIDLAFDLAGNARLELAISRAIEIAAQSLEPLDAVAIVVDEHPGGRRRLRRTVSALRMLAARTGICNVTTSDVVQPEFGSWDVRPVADKVRTQLAEYANAICDKVVRRRGVFQSPFDQRFFRYWYSAASAADEIEHVFRAYLEERSATHVVYDHNCESWLRVVIESVCDGKYELLSSDDDAITQRAFGAPHAGNGKISVVIVGPMLRTGTSFRRMFTAVDSWADSVRLFAIMANESDSDRKQGYYFTKSFPLVAEHARVEIDYVVPVRHMELEEPDWRLDLAVGTDPSEVEVPGEAWGAPSAVAMWDLVDSLPMGVEEPWPISTRPRIHSFPQLRNLTAEDATWLAETFLRIAEKEYELSRSLIMVVMPEEEDESDSPVNGARPLSEAFKKRLRVSTQLVRRADIDRWDPADVGTLPSYLVRALQDHVGYEVLIIDESAVSFGTILQLHRMARHANSGRAPVLSATVVEALTKYRRDIPGFRSLFQWSPVVMK